MATTGPEYDATSDRWRINVPALIQEIRGIGPVVDWGDRTKRSATERYRLLLETTNPVPPSREQLRPGTRVSHYAEREHEGTVVATEVIGGKLFAVINWNDPTGEPDGACANWLLALTDQLTLF